MMIQRTLAAVVLVVLILVGVNGCGSLAPPPAQVVLRFAPPTPTHLVFVTRMSVSLSGPAAEGNPLAKRGQATTERETLDITSADAGAAFDLRGTKETRSEGVTLRVSHTGEIQRLILDAGRR